MFMSTLQYRHFQSCRVFRPLHSGVFGDWHRYVASYGCSTAVYGMLYETWEIAVDEWDEGKQASSQEQEQWNLEGQVESEATE